MELPNFMEVFFQTTWMKLTVFAKNLKFLRKSNDISQAEMFDRCGIKSTTWSNYENGITEPDFATLISISKLFEVQIHDLILTEIENVQGNDLKRDGINKAKSTGKGTGKGTGNATLRVINETFKHPSEDADSEEQLTIWMLFEQLKQLNEKIDQMRVSIEKLSVEKEQKK